MPHIGPNWGSRAVANAGLRGDISERAVAVVVVERVVVDARHEEIRIAVVIVIAYGDAAVEAAAGQSRGLCHVGEHAVAIVAEKAVAVFGIVFLQRRQIGAVGEEDIGTPIAVVIENGHAHRPWWRARGAP